VALNLGTRIGVYEVTAAIGVGGMGEVYRARDTELRRDVALKILPDAVGADTERVSRFRREAQVLASLNHPHIAAIYGVAEFDGARALVLELVEGETLAVRVTRGRLPVAEVIALARQVADALQVAHEHGIVHRDLKPANIMVTPDGVVKVLDFGLAKITPADGSEPDRAHSPTVTVRGTIEGVILGTAAYMSPEQAKGRPADRRADLWAFGAVVYEMLTGSRPFDGDDVATILAHIITREPEWRRLPADTPVSIVRLLRRCLEKDRKRRLDSAGAARLEIDDASLSSTLDGAAAVGGRSNRRTAAWALAAAVVAASLVFVTTRAMFQPSSQGSAATLRFPVTLPPSQRLPAILEQRDLALSPDGRRLVYRVGGSADGGPLAVRSLEELEGRLLPGIDDALGPFFSPDGRWIGFFAHSAQNSGIDLKKISIEGGPPIIVAAGASSPNGTWATDDTIFVAGPGGGVFQVAAAGGDLTLVSPATSLALSPAAYLSALPGRRAVLMTIRSGTWLTDFSDAQVTVLDLNTGERKPLIRGIAPTYVPESAKAGFLVYVAERTLFAVRFDLDGLRILGDPVPLVEHVAMSPRGAARYDISRNGTLIYAPPVAAASSSFVWVDRAGRETPTALPARAYSFVRLAPDGTQVALQIREDRGIWIGDLRRNTLRRLTSGASEDGFPIWTPDARSIVFNTNRDGAMNLFVQPADGSRPAEGLTAGANSLFPNSFAPDGRHMLAAQFSPATKLDVVLLEARSSQTSALAAGVSGVPFVLTGPLVKTPAVEFNAIASPDGRFYAYQSNGSGRSEVYVSRLPMTAGVRWQVSTSGGSSPVWAPNDRELFYRDGSGAVIAVPFEVIGATWRTGAPARLLDAKYAAPGEMANYDIAPDGRRFLMLKETGHDDESVAKADLVVVLNWIEELKQRLPLK